MTVTCLLMNRLMALIDTVLIFTTSSAIWHLVRVFQKHLSGIVAVRRDLLKLLPNAARFWAALGGWTFEFEDYIAAGAPTKRPCSISGSCPHGTSSRWSAMAGVHETKAGQRH